MKAIYAILFLLSSTSLMAKTAQPIKLVGKNAARFYRHLDVSEL